MGVGWKDHHSPGWRNPNAKEVEKAKLIERRKKKGRLAEKSEMDCNGANMSNMGPGWKA